MCWACAYSEMEGVPVLVTQEMLDITAKINRLYTLPDCSVGGPLHIITDDTNVDDRDLHFCDRELRTHWSTPAIGASGIALCREILTGLRPLSRAERAVVVNMTRGQEMAVGATIEPPEPE